MTAPIPTCSQGTAASIAFSTPNRSRSRSRVVAPRRRGGSDGTARLRISSVSSIGVSQCVAQYSHNQLFKTDTRRPGSHRHQAVIGHAGYGIHFQQPEFALFVLHDVYPAPGPTADYLKCIQSELLQSGFIVWR